MDWGQGPYAVFFEQRYFDGFVWVIIRHGSSGPASYKIARLHISFHLSFDIITDSHAMFPPSIHDTPVSV